MDTRTSETRGKKSGLRLIIVGAVLLLLLMVSVLFQVAHSPRSQLSAYSDDWNDVSMFARDLGNSSFDVRNIISSPLMLDEEEDPGSMLFIALGIEKSYTPNEADSIVRFVNRGGCCIIADDNGYGNSIAGRYSVHFERGRLYDEQFQLNPSYVVATVDDDIFNGALLFDEPTGMTMEEGHPLVESTSRSWIDSNFNRERDIIDPGSSSSTVEMFKSYTLVMETNPYHSYHSSEEGNVIFISDPSLFINAMYLKNDNRAFLGALVNHLLSAGGTVVFDESRHSPSGPGEALQQEGLYLLVSSTSDIIIKILVSALLIPMILLVVFLVGDPPALIHKQDLSTISTNRLSEWDLSRKDTAHLRLQFLEKVRRIYSLDREEFSRLSTKELSEFVREPLIMRFLTKRRWQPTRGEMENILDIMDRWGGS